MTTARLGFGTWTTADLELLRGIFGDPEVTRFEGGDWTDQDIRDRLRVEIANFAQYRVQYWPVFGLRSGEHVGCCGLRPHDAGNGVWEFGCQLRRNFWSYGLGREVGEAVIAHGFGELGVRALCAGHHPANAASRRFLHYLGFVHTHDEYFALTGLDEPRYLLAKTTARPDLESASGDGG